MGDIDMTEDLKLKVGELTERGDFGRGIIRMSAKDMKRIGITEGDIVERAIDRAILSGARIEAVLGEPREWLLARGARINREGNEWSALHYAVFAGQSAPPDA